MTYRTLWTIITPTTMQKINYIDKISNYFFRYNRLQSTYTVNIFSLQFSYIDIKTKMKSWPQHQLILFLGLKRTTLAPQRIYWKQPRSRMKKTNVHSSKPLFAMDVPVRDMLCVRRGSSGSEDHVKVSAALLPAGCRYTTLPRRYYYLYLRRTLCYSNHNISIGGLSILFKKTSVKSVVLWIVFVFTMISIRVFSKVVKKTAIKNHIITLFIFSLEIPLHFTLYFISIQATLIHCLKIALPSNNVVLLIYILSYIWL